MNNLFNPQTKQFTTSTDVSGSRAIDGTVYHNTTNKPRSISALCALAAGHLGDQLYAFCDVVNGSTVQVWIGLSSSLNADARTVNFIVPPGYFYAITNAGAWTKQSWVEVS